jgi:predicted DNA-binding antitoxin AbrB/MazE fold protein
MNQANPLKQYFRRPGLYLKLPSGGAGYPVGSINMPDNGELPVYPMTAIDEITTKTPDALFNGVAVVEIIKSCVPNIIDPWQVSNVDLDAILIAIKAASNGNEMDLETVCPSCSELGKYGLQLISLLSTIKSGDYNTKLEIDDLQIKLKPLKFVEINEGNTVQFELQRAMIKIQSIEDETEKMKASSEALSSIQAISMQIVANCIEYIKTPESTVLDKNFIMEYLQNCDKKTFEKIRDTTIALRETSEIKPLKLTCASCSYEYSQPFTLNVSDFFD